jgi:hypothetical protein
MERRFGDLRHAELRRSDVRCGLASLGGMRVCSRFAGAVVVRIVVAGLAMCADTVVALHGSAGSTNCSIVRPMFRPRLQRLPPNAAWCILFFARRALRKNIVAPELRALAPAVLVIEKVARRVVVHSCCSRGSPRDRIRRGCTHHLD